MDTSIEMITSDGKVFIPNLLLYSSVSCCEKSCYSRDKYKYEKVNFTNDETGEVKEMCKVNYVMPVEENERFCGNAIFECYIPIENFDKLKKYVLKPNLEFVYEERALKNGFKIFPIKIADVNLRKA